MKKESVLNLSLIIILVYLSVYTLYPKRDFAISSIKALDAETQLSLGLSLDFATVGIYELTLLDRVSDKVAMELMKSRGRIIENVVSRGATLPATLQTVKGIGPKGSKYLSENLDIRPLGAE